jgi:ankyrin repeat protein
MPISAHKAAKQGDVERLKAIHTAGQELNERNIYGRTPLATAIQYGQAEAVKFLRANGGTQ